MSRFLAADRCPDCGSHLDGRTRCPSCGLLQVGQVADDLRASLRYADQILDVLRRVSAAEPVAAAPAPAAVLDAPAPGPAPASEPRRGLPAVSVPVVLLGLGTVCVLVAAVVFVAVTWTDLSLGWRTTILLAVTALGTAAAAWAVRKGLRGAAEALTAVSSGLLLIDLLAGNSAGLPLLSSLHGNAFGWAVAGVMAGTGLAWVLLARRILNRALLGEQVVVVLAALAMVWLARNGWEHDGVWLAGVVAVAAAGLAQVLRLLRAPVVAVSLAVLAGLSWLTLAALGLVRALVTEHTAELLLELDGVPLLLASALAAVVALLPAVQPEARTVAGACAVAGPVVLALLPTRDLTQTAGLLVVAGAVPALALGATVVARPWRDGLRAVATGTAVLPAAALTYCGGLALARAYAATEALWTRGLTDPLPGAFAGLPVQPWALAPATGLLAAGAAVVLGRGLRAAGVSAVLGVAGGAVAGVLLGTWPLLVVGLVLAATAAASVGLYARHRHPSRLLCLPVAVLLGLAAATPSEGATVLFFALHGGLLVVVAGLLRGRARTLLAGSGVVVAAGSLEAVGELAGLSVAVAGLTLLPAAVAVALLAQRVAARPGRRAWRLGLEGAAVAMATLGLAQTLPEDVALTVGLTLAGGGAILVPLLSADRRQVAWAGSALLVLASWVRLTALSVEVVEAYTLPAAVTLVVTGLLWIRRTPSATSWQALGAPLVLAVGPSLAVALDEPTSLRALVVGIAGVGLVLAGTRLGWGAPLVVGGTVVAALALVNIAPYAAALPRWILFGSAGVALLALGVTWERRRQDLVAVQRYATRLR